jgi:error-prone DNA polymerase
VVGSAAWNLAELVELRRTGGLDAVAARLAAPAPEPDGETSDGETSDGETSDGETSGNGASDSGRRIQLPTGYELNPWADLRPAGEGAASGRKLWHQSPGSAG